MIFIVLIGKK